MRVALIDHHDSFTAMVADVLARVCGRRPDVFRHDAVAWSALEAGGYELFVLSPGPGRADRARDLGVTAQVLEAWRGPLFGVCLGHQALCLHAGGSIAPGRRPAHGVVTPIHHDGAGLFAGLADVTAVARYHSWVVAEPGKGMTVTARAADGAIMAVAARDRPQWGVQFHPESIGTLAGAALMANVARLARAQGGEPPRLATPTAPSDRRGSGAPPRVTPTSTRLDEQPPRLTLAVKRLPFWREPEAAFLAHYAGSTPAFWLDSAVDDAPPGGGARWSFMGDASGPHAEAWRYSVATGAARILRHGQKAMRRRGDVFTLLGDAVAARRTRSAAETYGADAPPFCGGFVGALGYGLAAHATDSPRPPVAVAAAGGADAELVFADRIVAFDHHRRQIWLLALDDDARRAATWLSAMAADVEALGPAPQAVATPRGWRFRPQTPRSDYAAAIRAAQAEIRAGESYEVCLTTAFVADAPGDGDALTLYRAIRRANPAPYAAFLRFGAARALLCASPERFLRIGADGAMEAKPIKGTAPRGRDAAEDAVIARALEADAKTRAENLMIVDVLRNDLARSAVTGSVHAPALFTVERHPHVHQLVSTVRADLRPEIGPLEAVRAAFPGGSMTGAPKPRTMAIIDRLERRARGYYAGAAGYLGLDGAVDLNIVIRTLELEGGRARIGVGGAILAASDVEAECDEVWWKAAGVLDGLAAAPEAQALWAADETQEAV